MSNHDQRFFDVFMVVVGGLILVAVTLIFIARYIGTAQEEWVRTQPEAQAQVTMRIAPVGRAALPSEEPEAPAAAIAAPTQPAVATLTGPQVYNTACLVCHGGGIGGAPRVGQPADWTERLTQDIETIYRHSLEGFTGSAGYMPPKGGRADLSDEEIIAAVDFMIGESR